LKAELELSQSDGGAMPVERVLADLNDAFALLRAVEVAAFGLVAVLVVDDDERLAELTARGLRRLGYEAEAVGTFRELRPNEIVVFDLSLASGLDESMRSALIAARPIVVTGATDPGSRALASRLDSSDYLVKPVEMDDLVAAISRRLAERG
jgi:DNA-binding response OmpR family regulator